MLPDHGTLAPVRKSDRTPIVRPYCPMVVRNVVRVGAIFGSMGLLLAACSGKVVPLDKGGSKSGDGGSGGAAARAGGNGADAVSPDAAAGGSADGSVIPTSPAGRVPNRTGVKTSHKLDLLFMVDNSLSMADKQVVLAQTIPDLVERIADPSSGIDDLHVGVITSSIGGHGSTTLCVGNDSGTITEQEENDHGWLVAKRPRFEASPGALAPQPEGFIAWTPDMGTAGLSAGIANMVGAAGEHGCGLESQLEAVYRFLADPRPYQTIVVQNCGPAETQFGTFPEEPCAFPQGIDDKLLAQRQAFLRPDSAVAIVALTDENDCSIRESGQYYYAARDNIILPHGSSACATNPNDRCCYFCNSQPPDGCAADPTCGQPTPRTQDQPNLRCFNQLQRFGIDFLYPTDRYVNALHSTTICPSRADLAPITGECPDKDGDRKPDLFDNPLLVDKMGRVRDPSMVYFVGIVGVPYQDLQAGQSPTSITYRASADLNANHVWDVVLGNANPGNGAPPISPSDALMIESKDPRGGYDGESPPVPLAGTLAPPLANPVNGHEWANMDQDDLQYACIFPVPGERDCAQEVQKVPPPGCDCKPGKEGDNNPLCQTPTGQYTTVQKYAKAYPGLRELQVIKSLGANGLAASICARNLIDDSRQDYGYRPAIELLLRQLGHSIK